QAEDGIRDLYVTGVQTCALPISFEHPPGPGCDEQETHVRAGRAALREQPGGGEEPGVRQPVCPRTPRLDRTGAGTRHSARQDQEIGRASCRERVENSVVAGALKE